MKIKTAEFVVSNSRASGCPDTQLPEYAFIGRSNVGKSSLINMLTGRKRLAMTSATPGKTMLINHFKINDEWFLVDLPGYGYARRSKSEVARLYELINDYVLNRQQLTNLFLLIDPRVEPQAIDLDFVEFLGEHGVPFSIVFTKADKLKPAALQQGVNRFLDRLREQWEELPPYFVSSAESGRGRDEILSYIEQINQQS